MHGLIVFWFLFFVSSFSINLFFEERTAFLAFGVEPFDTIVKTLWLSNYSFLAILGYTAFNLMFAIIVKTKIDMVDRRISQEFSSLFTYGECHRHLDEVIGISLPKQRFIFPSTPKILFEDGSMSLELFRLFRGSTDQVREFAELADIPIVEEKE